MKPRSKRLRRVQSKFDLMPVREEVLNEEFEVFQLTGELPDDDRVAQAVVNRAISGNEQGQHNVFRVAEQISAILDGSDGRIHGKTLRELLLTQAGYGPPALREPARIACRVLSAWGDDLTDPTCLADAEIPEHPALGLHVLGFPEKLAKAPYVRQARRLFARFAQLRQRTPDEESPFWEKAADAAIEFRRTGELPTDPLQVDLILAEYETECLGRHRGGEDVKQEMALLDAVARSTGDERKAALGKLCEVVVERYRGKL